MIRVGILALQGAFIEHRNMLEGLGIECFEIRKPIDLEREMDGLILPGGESTVMGKLLRDLRMFDGIRNMVLNGLPVLGTCAGAILMADDVIDGPSHLATVPMTIRRNAYGRQLGSFNTISEFAGKAGVPMTFIRAPIIESVGEDVDILASVDGVPVAVRYGDQVAMTFHPELSDDTTIHSYFVDIMKG